MHMRQTYVEFIPEGTSVVDLSCGSGEFLESLRERDIRARGVEEEPTLVGECKAQGLDCEEANAADYLKSLEEGELGLIFCSGLPERLSYAAFCEVVTLALTKLGEDGVFLVEGINSSSPSGDECLKRDPRNVRAFNPHAMSALLSAQGFRNVTLEFADPVTGARSKEDFGGPYYLLIARK
jgi:predicted TPR repeat methyltransferase